jgi:type II secretory pathway pseudopilin PulG
VSINKTLKGRTTEPTAGFTLLEILIILAVLGILCAIVSPSWLMFINNHRLKVSVDRAYWAMELARSNAKRDKISWQASFKEVGENVQVAVHPAHITPAQVPANQWKNLEEKIKIHTAINDKGKSETSLLKINESNKATDKGTIRRAMFNFRGCAIYNSTDECGQTSLEAKGRLTLFHPNLKNSERCVIVSTILGHKRISQRQPKAQDGRYCY